MPFDGSDYMVVVSSPNPDGVANPPVAMTVDEQSGRIYWVQPQGGSASLGSTIRSAATATARTTCRSSAAVSPAPAWSPTRCAACSTGPKTARSSAATWTARNVTEIRAAVGGQTPMDLALDPFAQRLYWLDTGRSAIVRANADGSDETLLVTGLAASARGVAVQPLQDALFYSSGGVMRRAALDGSNPLVVATLSGVYAGPSNLDPNTFPVVTIQPPAVALAIGGGLRH